MSIDPYAAPKTRVADAPAPVGGNENFIQEGRSVPAGNGWLWVAQAWNIFKRDALIWIVILVIFLAIAFVLVVIPIIGGLALWIVSPMLIGGVMLGCEASRNGDSVTVGHLFAGFSNNAGKLAAIGAFGLVAHLVVALVVGMIFGMSIFAAAISGGGADPAAWAGMGMTFVLALLVGLALTIPIYMAIWLSYPLVLFNDFTVGKALGTSFRACLKNIVPFLVYGIVMFVLSIAASIPVFLGWLVLGPMTLIAVYTSYRDIFHAS